MSDDADLPKALVKRVVKNKLGQFEGPGEDGVKKDFQLNKDALLAFSECGKIFINYLTATANDICKENKRQTINAEDVLSALEDLDFGDLKEPLRDALEAFKRDTKEKNRKKAEQVKKRKAEKSLASQAEQAQYEGAEQGGSPVGGENGFADGFADDAAEKRPKANDATESADPAAQAAADPAAGGAALELAPSAWQAFAAPQAANQYPSQPAQPAPAPDLNVEPAQRAREPALPSEQHVPATAPPPVPQPAVPHASVEDQPVVQPPAVEDPAGQVDARAGVPPAAVVDEGGLQSMDEDDQGQAPPPEA